MASNDDHHPLSGIDHDDDLERSTDPLVSSFPIGGGKRETKKPSFPGSHRTTNTLVEQGALCHDAAVEESSPALPVRILADPRALPKALVIFGTWLGVMLALMLISTGGQKAPLVTFVTRGPLWTPLAGVVFLGLTSSWVGWQGQGWKGPHWPAALQVIWPLYLVILPALGIACLLRTPAGVFGWSFFNCVFVGISEEWMFRGVLLKGLRSRLRLWPSVWIGSLLFGAVHTLNALRTGDWTASCMQAGAATVLGLILCAYRIRTQSLWPGILTHMLWDFALVTAAAGAMGTGVKPEATTRTPAMTAAMVFLALFLAAGIAYASFLLRPSKVPPEEVAEAVE